jgi:hypothetical protein
MEKSSILEAKLFKKTVNYEWRKITETKHRKIKDAEKLKTHTKRHR